MVKSTDSNHRSALSSLKSKALRGNDYFSDWATRATTEPEQVYKDIVRRLGHIRSRKPWDVFAKIYNEDTPDKVFGSAVKFVDKIFKTHNITRNNKIVDVACGTGAVARTLAKLGYKDILAFDESKAMLAEAKSLSKNISAIRLTKSSITKLHLPEAAKGVVWIDFSSNFALSESELRGSLTSLVKNIKVGGVLIFDIRTRAGWNVDFFKEKVTAYETHNFQRLWINLPNYKKEVITFDIFIRRKNKSGKWLPWQREQMTERMWNLKEVQGVVKKLKDVKHLGTYTDNFTPHKIGTTEPGLAYIALKKI